MITKENAIKIGASFIGELVISNAYKISEERERYRNIYFLPENCYYINIPNVIDNSTLSVFSCSLLIAVDKTDGSIRYFGSAYDEG